MIKTTIKKFCFTGMVIFNENKKYFQLCDIQLEDNEMELVYYEKILC